MKDKELRKQVVELERVADYNYRYLIGKIFVLETKLTRLERYLKITEVTTPAETKYIKKEGKG